MADITRFHIIATIILFVQKISAESDNEEPYFVDIPEHIAVNTERGLPRAVVFWQQPSVTDNSGGPLTLTSNFNPGDRFPIGTTNIIYTAIDSSGNEESAMFIITVIDAELPDIVNAPSSQNVNTNPFSATVTVWWTPPTASDNSDEPITLTSDYQPGDNFTIGITTVTYTAVDVYGNRATYEFEVIVTDAEPPVIGNTPFSQHVNTYPNSATTAVWWTPPTANDNSGEPVTLISNYHSGDNFTIGNTTVTYTAVDVYGNMATYEFDVIVTDAEPPVICNIPFSKHVNTDPNSATAVVWWTKPTAYDNSGEPVTLISNYHSGDNFTIGNTTVTYTAVDVYGNRATYEFDVIVTDAEPPVIGNTSFSQHANTDPNSGTAAVWWTPPTAYDNSGEPVILISNYHFGDNFTIGNTTVTYTVVDVYGNMATYEFEVIVTDAEPPVIVNTPFFQHVNTDPNSATAAVWWTPPTANDNSGESVTLISNYHSGDNFTIGNTTVTYTVVDVYGNLVTYEFDVIVTDAEPPVIVNTPYSQHVNKDPNSATVAVWWTPPTANDNSGEPVILISNYHSGDHFTIGNTTVTYTAVDVSGNMATYSFHVVVTVRKDQNAAQWMIVGYSAALLISFIIIPIVGVCLYKLRKPKGVREETGHEPRDTRPTETTMSTAQNEYMTSILSPLAEFKGLKTGLPESCYYDDVPTEKSLYQNIANSNQVKGQNEENIYDLPEENIYDLPEHRNSPSTILLNRYEGVTYQNV